MMRALILAAAFLAAAGTTSAIPWTVDGHPDLQGTPAQKNRKNGRSRGAAFEAAGPPSPRQFQFITEPLEPKGHDRRG